MMLRQHLRVNQDKRKNKLSPTIPLDLQRPLKRLERRNNTTPHQHFLHALKHVLLRSPALRQQVNAVDSGCLISTSSLPRLLAFPLQLNPAALMIG